MRKFIFVAAIPLLWGASVLTSHYSNSRLGTTDPEIFLTPTLVASPNFGKNCTYPVDGDVYAQPLYVPNVSGMPGQASPRNVLVVATMHASVYAFDADRCEAAFWRTQFGAHQDAGSYPGNIGQLIYDRELGCKGTPAIDASAAVIYVVCSTASSWVLRRMDLHSGGVYPPPPSSGTSSVTLTGTVSGVTFCPLCQNNTAGVTVAGNKVYVAFGSMNDKTNNGNWYGWIFAVNTSDFTIANVFCTTCAGGNSGGGVWQAGGGLSVDGSGNLYAITGNGSGTPGPGNYTLSVLKFDSSLSVLDWYAPSNYADLNAGDEDLASGRPMLVPSTDLIVFGAKDFNIYSIHSGCMGNIGGANNGCTAPQVFATGSGAITTHEGVYGGVFIPTPKLGIFPNTNGNIYRFALTGTTWNTTPTISSATYEFPGAQMMATCVNGAQCVVWATSPVTSSALTSPQPGKLLAINPTDLSVYWSSTTRATDAPGTLAKLTIPTAANGNIYMGTLDQTVVRYGPNLLNHILISH